jgi:hypothetical protein
LVHNFIFYTCEAFFLISCWNYCGVSHTITANVHSLPKCRNRITAARPRRKFILITPPC